MSQIILKVSLFLFLLSVCVVQAQITESQAKVFQFEIEQNLPGSPEIIYDAISGDISAWWDHSFSENPVKLVIEAKPGGHFYETFNDRGDGVIHAKVIGAHRGKFLRMDGPLGLAGKALHMVTTYHFKALGSDSTHLKVEVHMAGEVDTKLAGVIQSVWNHFIIEQFTPYVQAGKHLQ